ncbi:S-methylmethionine--homocysteine S-methyltransferase BHMT2-like isoform X2 [Ostrea edulis]|uniref:S-methylmethionine--homocysteine S-methyltransferase BHMT2-like isoform X2 n=1 Tax=Ostrea edulis TaxID=37623 RepID=UPI0020958108|nr:S-methylmethionine--homocysteine S-methyltransferase BHMT2-like isoform X2 [Ostrea edulis]
MPGLLERLKNGESLVVAEGYIFEFERRGYLKSGSFVPEVVLDHPELVKSLHEEYVHAGSDVVLAFTYYAHREKLRLINRESDLKTMNMKALEIAREVADQTGTLMAGNICNSTVYKKGDEQAINKTQGMFKEQIEWAVEGGADFIVAETFGEFGEAMLALESIKQYGKGLPAVITLSVPMTMMMHDGIPVDEACKRLEDAGADVVGLNCGRGPETIIEPLKLVRKACRGPIAALPVPYRTNDNQVTFFSLTVPGTEKPAFPLDLSSCYCTREEIRKFAEECKNLGIQYVGLCCGNAPHFLREVAGVYGTPAAALKYSPEMEKHFIFGDEKKNDPYFTKTYKDAITKK